MKPTLRFLVFLALATPLAAEETQQRRETPSGPTLPVLNLSLEAVSPFVGVAQPAPPTFDVPRGVTLELRAVADRPAVFRWTGARNLGSTDRDSSALRRFNKPGHYTVTVSADFGPSSQPPVLVRTILVNVDAVRVAELSIRLVDPVPGTTEVGPRDRSRTCRASISHPRFKHLVEWRSVDDSAEAGRGLEYTPLFRTVGSHQIRVGNNRTQGATFETFDIRNVSRSGDFGDLIWYGFPITFTAATVPPGYERHVDWHVDTHMDMLTRAEPASGRGARFTTVFKPSGPQRLFWAMVYASGVESFDSPDQQPPPISANSGLEAPNDAGMAKLNLPRLPTTVNAGGVHLHAGEYTLSHTDLVIPGRGFHFVWRRHYRSREGRLTEMGHNWDFSYNIRVEVSLANPAQRWLLDGSSRRNTYDPVGGGCWAAAGHFSELCQQPDASYTLTFPNMTSWKLKAIDGSPTAGKILEIKDRNQNVMTFGYAPSGRLNSIVDTLGRVIQVAHNTDGFIESLTDFTGRQVQYAYYQSSDALGGAGDLKSWRTPVVTGTPNGNDFLSGKTTTCTYSRGFLNERLNHNLLSITDPLGRVIVQNEYSATTYPPDLLIGMTLPNGRITFYHAAQTPMPSNGMATTKAIVKDRAGNVREAAFNERNELVWLREFTGRAPHNTTQVTDQLNRPTGRLRPGDPAYFETRFFFNPDSLVTRIEYPRGNVLLNQYELDLNPGAARRSRGNLRVRRMQPGPAGGDQTEIVNRWEYNTVYNVATRQEDGRGNATVHTVDSSGNVIQTQHRIPSILENWEFNSFGQVIAHVLPDNGSGWRRRDEFTYYTSGSQQGYLSSEIVDALGQALVTSYAHNASGGLTAYTNAKGAETTFVVNALDQVVRETSSEVSPGSGIHYVTDRFYDAADSLVRLDVRNLDADGILQPNQDFTTEYERDALRRIIALVEEVDETRSIRTEYGHDANDHQTLIRTGEATAGRQPAATMTIVYDERDLIFREIRAIGDPDQSTTQLDYDNNRNLVAVIEGLESSPHVETRINDGFGRPVSLSDAMGNVSTLRYDANGNQISTRLDGELVDVPGSAANVRLREAFSTFDFMDRAIRVDEAFFNRQTQAAIGDGLSTTIIDYTGTSAISRIEDDNGHETLFAYDTTGELAQSTDPEGNLAVYLYDENLNVVTAQETEKCGLGGPDEIFTTTYTYDELNRLIRLEDSSGSIFDYAYDSRGNEARTSDAARADPGLPGNVVTHEYDGLNRQTTTTRIMTSDGTGAGSVLGSIVTRQTWDDSGRLASQIDANDRITAYEYDPLGRVTRTTMADGTFASVTYDVHDHEILVIQPNGTSVTSNYDALGGLSSRTIAPGTGVSGDTTFELYEYDGDSHVVRVEDNDAVVLRTYDSLWNVSSETLNGATSTFTNDGKGNQTAAIYPGGRSIATTFDGSDRKLVISDPVILATYAYCGPSRVQRRTYRNGTVTTYAYDGKTGVPNPAGDHGVKRPVRTTHLRTTPPLVIDDRSYAWNRTGSRTEQKDLRLGSPGSVTRYSFDSAYRLNLAQDFDPNSVVLRDAPYVLDGAGNRLSVGGPGGGSYTLSPALPSPADSQVNQYTSTPFDSRSYDDNGDLRTITPSGPGGLRTLSYDYAGRLVEVHEASASTTVHFRYDPFGRRIARTVTTGSGTTETRYFFDEWQEIEEQDGVGTTVATYVYGNNVDEVLNMERAGGSYFFHGDDLDGTRAVTNALGTVVERYDYGDFGRPVFLSAGGAPLTGSTIGNTILFAGRRYDPLTGFYDYRRRQLDPLAGRFVTRDPTGLWGDDENDGNPYTYAGNTPWTMIDPTGERALEPQWATDAQGDLTCSAEQQGMAWSAADKAQELVRTASGHLGSLKPRERWCDAGYRMWFGSYSKTRFRTVRRIFGEIRLWLDSRPVPVDCENPCTMTKDGVDVNAHTDHFPGAMIGVCKPFFGDLAENNNLAEMFDVSANDMRGAGLVHEMSHWFGTNVSAHERYGPTECLRFAQSHPVMATRNAQNYALHTLSPIQGGCGSVDVWAKGLANAARETAGKVVKSVKRAGEKVSKAIKRIKKKFRR